MMQIAFVVVALTTVVINVLVSVADYARAPFALATAAEVNVPPSWQPWLATCKLTGAVGIAVGLLADRPVLVAVASAGLTLFFLGALAFHVKARVFYNLAFPGFFFATAATTVVLAVLTP